MKRKYSMLCCCFNAVLVWSLCSETYVYSWICQSSCRSIQDSKSKGETSNFRQQLRMNLGNQILPFFGTMLWRVLKFLVSVPKQPRTFIFFVAFYFYFFISLKEQSAKATVNVLSLKRWSKRCNKLTAVTVTGLRSAFYCSLTLCLWCRMCYNRRKKNKTKTERKSL